MDYNNLRQAYRHKQLPITKTICQLGFRCGQQSSQPATTSVGFDRKATRNPQLHIVLSVTVHCKKDKTDDRMTKVFLLHKDKEKGNPPHIQAHLSLPDTKANASQSQKSLHFADPQTDR